MFNKNEVICFFGDSITAQGHWIAEIYQNLAKTKKIKCFNCGVPGATTNSSVGRIYGNCLIHNPDWVVIMFGINDIGRDLYGDSYQKQDKYERIEAAFKLHIEKYEEIIRKVKEYGSKIILCFPIPYDEVSNRESENLKCQKGLDRSIEFLKEMAEKYECGIVNFRDALYPFLKEDAIQEDRVHPTVKGHHLMAQTFLKDTGEIDTPDYNGEFEYEEWNKKRFESEQKVINLNFVEYGTFFYLDPENKMDLWERRDKIKEIYGEREDKETYVPRMYKYYVENVGFREKYISEFIELSK